MILDYSTKNMLKKKTLVDLVVQKDIFYILLVDYSIIDHHQVRKAILHFWTLVKEKEKLREALTQCHLHSLGLGFGQN